MLRSGIIYWCLFVLASIGLNAQRPVSIDTAAWHASIRKLPSYEAPTSLWEKNRAVAHGKSSRRTEREAEKVFEEQPVKRRDVPKWVNQFLRILLIILAGSILFTFIRKIRVILNPALSSTIQEVAPPESTLTAFTEPWFLDQIAQAKKEQDAIQTIRYQFLYALWLLNSHKLVNWRKEKTNAIYLKELQQLPSLQKQFGQRAQFYELVWYGRIAVHEGIMQSEVSKSDAFLEVIKARGDHA